MRSGSIGTKWLFNKSFCPVMRAASIFLIGSFLFCSTHSVIGAELKEVVPKQTEKEQDMSLGTFGVGDSIDAFGAAGRLSVSAVPEYAVHESSDIARGWKAETVLSVPFGKASGEIGFANGPGHTPYPESAQSFKIIPEGFLITDTFNKRFLIFSEKGDLSRTITPRVDVDYTFYSAVERLGADSFVATDTMNMSMLVFNGAGDVVGPAMQPSAIDDATALFLTRDSMIYMGDKGRTVKMVRAMNTNLELIASIPVKGLTEQGFAPVPSGGFAALVWGETAENPMLEFWNRDGKSEEVKFVRESSVVVSNTSLPGRFKIAGIDARGRTYLHWTGLKCHLSAWKGDLGPLAAKCPESQPVTLFRVFERDGTCSDSFAIPSSTAPENAVVSVDGEIFVLAYDADTAPSGNLKIIRIKRKQTLK
ncbi:MAG: hypothetical protein CVV64_07595 [Candidatus Wallbacteria bacterium HGW-Wallbacteria-1]|uniref:Uncharacterized protein n=1 Tax=Candidatus Wallbacteria bacterium HGW-Wallbacteria-1 TaxID=2013854 RepID=A0A2N1PQW5_9BACT|nr:MAG: hypothetical protein CVV64_07595 [Candidatus Wallbacteria bacterium HGW-Wallbacteria-1]